MAVILSAHAAEGLTARKLQLDWVERTIQAPERTRPDPRDPELTQAYLAIREADGRILRVVYKAAESDILVVTAFSTVEHVDESQL